MREDNSHQVTGEAPAVVGAVTVPLSQWNALKGFSFEILSTLYGDAPRLDDGDVQDVGIKHGLVVDHVVTDSDCSDWRDYGVGETIQRVVQWLHDVNCNCNARVTAGVPSTLGAGGSLEDDLTSTSELSRLRTALEEAYGLLWMMKIDTRTETGLAASMARKILLAHLDRAGQARGITFAREALRPALEGEKT